MDGVGQGGNSYLNLESTKTVNVYHENDDTFYSYLNLESTKTLMLEQTPAGMFYSYLNLESTKTSSRNHITKT